MWKFDWTQYVGEQIKWAEALITKADEIPGYESDLLREKAAQTLTEISQLLEKEYSDFKRAEL